MTDRATFEAHFAGQEETVNKKKIAVVGASPGLAIGAAMSLIMAAKQKRRRAPVVWTDEQWAAQATRKERAEWNARVEAQEAAKRAAK